MVVEPLTSQGLKSKPDWKLRPHLTSMDRTERRRSTKLTGRRSTHPMTRGQAFCRKLSQYKNQSFLLETVKHRTTKPCGVLDVSFVVCPADGEMECLRANGHGHWTPFAWRKTWAVFWSSIWHSQMYQNIPSIHPCIIIFYILTEKWWPVGPELKNLKLIFRKVAHLLFCLFFLSVCTLQSHLSFLDAKLPILLCPIS